MEADGGVTTAEVEFLAEDEIVRIVPNFEEDELDFIRGSFGPFIPQTPVDVPLFLAIALRRQHKCRIQCPEWMSAAHLRQVKRLEKESAVSSLQPLPQHYMAVSSLLLQHGSEDVEDVHEVRSLLEDIENLRQHKIRIGMRGVAEEEADTEPMQYLKLNNAADMEIHAIRPLLLLTLTKFYEMYRSADAARVAAGQHLHRIAQDDDRRSQEEERAAREAQYAEDDEGARGPPPGMSAAARLQWRRTMAPGPSAAAADGEGGSSQAAASMASYDSDEELLVDDTQASQKADSNQLRRNR